MSIKPHLTEKSLSQSRQGRFTFLVPEEFSRGRVRWEVESLFSVKVDKVWTLKHSGEQPLPARRRRAFKSPVKLAVVSLKSGSFDFFEESPAQPESTKTGKVK